MSMVIIDYDAMLSLNTMTIVKGQTMIIHNEQRPRSMQSPANNNQLMRDALKLQRNVPMATMKENRGSKLQTNGSITNEC